MTADPRFLAAMLLFAAACIGAWRLWRWQAPPPRRAPALRLLALMVLQFVTAALLHLTLFPPPGLLADRPGTLVVATAATPREATLAAGDSLVALPEAPAIADAARVPDLAAALRRHPGTTALRILGHGLPPRDRAAARAAGLALAFDPAPLPPGLHALALPGAVAPGASFRVGGSATPGGTAELVDPAGTVVATASLTATGDFVLAGTARLAGPADFTLHLRDARSVRRESLAVPVVATVQPPPRLLIVAGAAGPDLKYLRRWASDAGIAAATSIAAGSGLDLGDAPARLDSTRLARLDLLVLDERSWARLAPPERAAVLGAVRRGLGLLLRVTGPVADPVRRQWASLGLPLGRDLRPWNPSALPGARPGAAPTLELTRLAVAAGPSAVPLAPAGTTNTAAPLTGWRGLGTGRIAVWPVTDLYALVLAGEGQRHAALWADLLATLARPQIARAGARLPRIDGPAHPDQRLAVCDLPPATATTAAVVNAPDGTSTVLLPDPETPGCAAFWPRLAGWHRLRTPGAALDFAVTRPSPGRVAAEARAATWQLQSAAVSDTPRLNIAPGLAQATAPGPGPGPSWPWFAGFLAAAALGWWLERAHKPLVYNPKH